MGAEGRRTIVHEPMPELLQRLKVLAPGKRWRDGSCRLASAASLLHPYPFLGYAALEDNGAVEIGDLDCIGGAERLAIRAHADAG